MKRRLVAGIVVLLAVVLAVAGALVVDLLRNRLISNVDQALYRAKETGRNKVVIFKAVPAEQSSLKLA